MTTFNRSDVASNYETEDPRPPWIQKLAISGCRGAFALTKPSTRSSSFIDHSVRSVPNGVAGLPGYRQKSTLWTRRGAWASICLCANRSGIMHLARSVRTTLGGRLPRPSTLGVTILSAVDEGGIGRQEAISRSTHLRPCAETNWKTAEATSCPAGRVSRRYNWLSVHSNNSCSRSGALRTERSNT